MCRSVLQCGQVSFRTSIVRCSVFTVCLQYVAVCCCVLQRVVVWTGVVQDQQCVCSVFAVLLCVAACCSMLQCVAACCSVNGCRSRPALRVAVCLQYDAVFCCVLQFVAARCSVLLHAAVWTGVGQDQHCALQRVCSVL